MWKESYRIGIDLIDRQHEELFRATDTLVRAFKLIEIMTFVEPAEIDELVCSALAELSNITCGNAATALTEHGKVCDIKTPVVTAEPPCGLIDGMMLQTNVGGLEIVVQMEV